MAIRPTYCKKCGSKLVESQVSKGFDEESGKPRHEYRVQCPKMILGFWMDFGHTHAKTSHSDHNYWYVPGY